MNEKLQHKIIPIVHCFDNKYVVPAIVSIFSMLKNANKNFYYKIYILNSDITHENRRKLENSILDFDNAEIEFIDINDKYDYLFDITKSKGHYSKEMFCKFSVSTILEHYDKAVVSDVDVVFCGDISELYNAFDVNEDYYIYASSSILSTKDEKIRGFLENMAKVYTKDELKKLNWAGGLYVYNLKRMREDNIEIKFNEYAINNAHRLMQPEQDTINIICYPKIKTMPPNALVCTYAYDMFKSEEDYQYDKRHHTREEIIYSLENPIQLHYATHIKPWNTPCTKDDVWYKYLAQTNIYTEFIEQLLDKLLDKNSVQKPKTMFSFRFPFYKRKFSLIKEKI